MYTSRHIVPTNQPHGHIRSSGFAGYTGGGPGSGNPGGAGNGGGRNTTTPTGTYHYGTTFKVGDVVMLRTPCAPTFPEGIIVEITGIEPAPESATKRPGQDVRWLGRDEDSVYRFQRRYAKEHEKVISSVDIGHPPSHFDIVPAKGQPYSPDQYPLNSVLCTVTDMSFIYESNRNLIPVPKYTYCKVSDYTTRKGGRQAGRKQITKGKLERCFYVLQAKYLTYTWETEICSRKKEVSNFRALKDDEMQDYLARKLPANKVVNWQ